MTKSKTYSYDALFTRQRGAAPCFAMFNAPAGEVLEWAAIERLKSDGAGHQRLKSEAKVKGIQRFLAGDERNTIPTAVTVALRLPEFKVPDRPEVKKLTIGPAESAPGLIIDGQHRLFGMERHDPSMLVSVIALINADDEEIAFQFLVINNKATKVSTDHLKLLRLKYEGDALGKRLRTARMVLGRHAALVGVVDSSPDSPFAGKIIWPAEGSDVEAGLVRPAAIELALATIAQKGLPDLTDDDTILEFFFILWQLARDRWEALWTRDSRLLSKVGIVALTTFVLDDLVPLADRGKLELDNPDDLTREIGEIMDSLRQEFWTVEWTAKSLDTSAGRQMVVDGLARMRRNVRRGDDWYAEIAFVAPGS